MAVQRQRKHQLGVGSRLVEPPSPALVDTFRTELEYADVLFDGLSYADLAHALMLIEQGVIPEKPGHQLLRALVDLHKGGLMALRLDAKWGDLYNNRDAALEARLGATAGWIHAGRARREALTIAWLIHLRGAMRTLAHDVSSCVDAITDVARRHVDSLMPDFTYLQHAHPTTLGHYLLGFAYPLARDLSRLRQEITGLNASPAGCASTNGSLLPLDRARLCRLLGFSSLTEHNRDAMWQTDVPINAMAILVSLATTADRLAEELQIWSTEEFGFVELADRHCRTSVIMPNKKNPYALSHIRGKARELVGQLVSVITTNQTPSGQLDNRNTAYDLLPRATATVRAILNLLGEVVAQAQFDVARLEQQARSGGTWATELADLLLQHEGVDARTAHEIVGAVVRELVQRQVQQPEADVLSRCFKERTGRALKTRVRDLVRELDAAQIVHQRATRGGCAPREVRRMANELQKQVSRDTGAIERQASATRFPEVLRAAIAQRIGKAW